jgi:cytochrome c oxidase cbb3-type subunit 4
MSYDALRHFADSYGLAALLFIYLAMVGWAFRPGARAANDRAAAMIFGEDDETTVDDKDTCHG